MRVGGALSQLGEGLEGRVSFIPTIDRAKGQDRIQQHLGVRVLPEQHLVGRIVGTARERVQERSLVSEIQHPCAISKGS